MPSSRGNGDDEWQDALAQGLAMRFRRVFIAMAILVLAIVGIERLIAVRPAFLWSERANADACAVYRGLVHHLSSYKQAVFVRSGTIPWEETLAAETARIISGKRGEYSAPKTFERYRRSRGDVELGSINDEKEEFTVDTSGYFKEVAAERSLFIRHCFDAAEGSIYDGPRTLLNIREALLGSFDVRLWDVSSVGISPDGRHALLYAETYCGFLCGAGEFFLFERRDKTWVIVGASVAWIS